MSDFFAGVTGFKFPDTLWDKGSLPSVVGGPAGSDGTPDGVWWNDILHAPRYLLVVVSEPMRALSSLAYGVIFTNRLQRNSSSRVSMSTRATSQCLTRWTRETSCFACTRRIGRGSPRTRLQTHCHMLPYVPWLSCVLEISISSITSSRVCSTLTVRPGSACGSIYRIVRTRILSTNSNPSNVSSDRISPGVCHPSNPCNFSNFVTRQDWWDFLKIEMRGFSCILPHFSINNRC
jgi:hypothetical protein